MIGKEMRKVWKWHVFDVHPWCVMFWS